MSSYDHHMIGTPYLKVVLAMPCVKLQNAEIGEIIDEIKQVESQPMTKIDPIKSGFSIAGSSPYSISVIIDPVGKWTSNFPIQSNT